MKVGVVVRICGAWFQPHKRCPILAGPSQNACEDALIILTIEVLNQNPCI